MLVKYQKDRKSSKEILAELKVRKIKATLFSTTYFFYNLKLEF